MKILALEKDLPGVTAGQFLPHLKVEAARLWELYQDGALREFYFRRDRQAAVLVLECESVEEAESVLASLPLVKEGLIEFEVIPLEPYPGFGRLFGGQ